MPSNAILEPLAGKPTKNDQQVAKNVGIHALTDVQRRMLAVLSDGEPHTKAELFACLWDDRADVTAIRKHISLIRKFLRPYGHYIVCELVNVRAVRYRWVRLIWSAADSPPA